MLVQENDAAGGSGSLSQQLLGVLINGVSRASDGYLSKKFPLTSFNELEAYDAYGNELPRGAPGSRNSAAYSALAIFSNPVVIAVGVAVAISTIVFIAVKR